MVSSPTAWQMAREVWQIGVAALALVLSVWASGHAVLRKRDSRSAIAWVGFVWLVPLVGAVVYFVFCINRIPRQTPPLRRNLERYRAHEGGPERLPEGLGRQLPRPTAHLSKLSPVGCCRGE